MDLLRIVWLDHCSFQYSKWRDFDDIRNLSPTINTSVGFLLKETPVYLTIVATIHMEGKAGTGEMTILKKAITSRKKLGKL